MALTPRLKQEGDQPRNVARAVNSLLEGRINSVGEVTLGTGTTTTVVSDYYAHPASQVLLVPRSASAAAETPTLWTAGGSRQFTITHSSATSTDRTFGYVLLG